MNIKVKVVIEADQYSSEQSVLIDGSSFEEYNNEATKFLAKLKSKEENILADGLLDSFMK